MSQVLKSKWIAGVTPRDPVTHVAERALGARLQAVLQLLPAAAQHAHEDLEHVHQLRVATRRARAALDAFKSLVPKKARQRVADDIREVRQAAGEARDLDVFLLRLQKAELNDSMAPVVEHLRSLRSSAQQRIVAVEQKMNCDGHLASGVERLLSRIRVPSGKAPEDRTFHSHAVRQLGKLVKEFFKAGRVDMDDLAGLHRFRLVGKRLRYSMEVFAGAFCETFRTDLYPQMGKVQDRLGEVNDHFSALERLKLWRAESQDSDEKEALRELEKLERAGLRKDHKDFVRWWTPSRASRLRSSFDGYLDEDLHDPLDHLQGGDGGPRNSESA